MSYERDQTYLAKLWEELGEEPLPQEMDDQEDSDEEDHVEERQEDSESEQDLDSDSEPVDEPPRKKIKYYRDSVFIGKDNVTKWNKHKPTQNVRTRSKNIMIHLPGLKGAARQASNDILDIWSCFFTPQILNLIVDNTNLSISEHAFSEDYRTATTTDVIEIKALFGLLYLCAIRKTNHLNAQDLWKTNGTSIEMFRLTMSLERFRFLLRHLRFDNKATRAERQQADKLAAIRELFGLFVANCKNNYTNSEYTTVDEMLAAFRGRCNFRQYIPSKPNKYGIKIFALVDAKTFYTSNMEVYVGKQPEGQFAVENTGKAVVERLIEPIVNTGRNVTMDNWFTSLPLCQSLLEKKLTVVGTIKKNKREIPKEFVEGKTRPEGSSMFGFHKDGTLVSYIPRKGKNVLLFSTMHDDDSIDNVTAKPEIIIMYNETKSGVDVVDKLCATYNCARGTRKWPMVIFYRILNIAGINAFEIFRKKNPDTVMLRRSFLEQLSFDLVMDHLKRRATIQQVPRVSRLRIREICKMEPEIVVQEQDQIYGRCSTCTSKKSRKTKYKCVACKKFLCLEHVVVMCRECIEDRDNDNTE